MIMEDWEIRQSYRTSKYKIKQIQILAQINACDEKQILKICGLADEAMTCSKRKQLYIDMYKQGKYDCEIARAAGVTSSAVKAWRSKNMLPSNRERKPNAKYYARFLELYKCGFTDGQIARDTGVHKSSVWEWRKKRGLKSNFEKPKRRRVACNGKRNDEC
jgi:hypothetical protein